MSFRRSLAVVLVAAAIAVPTAALAASGGAPQTTPPSSEIATTTTSAAASQAAGTVRTPATTALTVAAEATSAGLASADPVEPPERIETRLACRLVREADAPDHRAGIACQWTSVDHPRAVGYRLRRAVDVPDPEHHRAVILRTADLDHTRHLDTQIRSGHTFHYAVQVVGAGGASLAWSNTVKVEVPPVPDPIEDLRLACEGVRADTEPPGVHRPGIACRWSPSTWPAFARYRLVRGDGEHRVVVFRTRDRDATRHLDSEVQPGGTYVYLVEAVAADGRVLGRSRPVRVTLPEAPPTAEQVPAAVGRRA